MTRPLKILHLEDLRSDAELINRALKKGKLDFERLVVDTKASFVLALTEFSPDIILSDHSLPSFNSHDALTILHDSGIKVPFILITANVSEEFAVDVIKRGADDYVLKDRLQRLPTAINNSVEKFRLEREQQNFIDKIIKNEKHYRALIENIQDAIILVNEKAVLVYQSPSTEHITGFTLQEMKDKMIFEHVHPEDKKYCLELFQQVSQQPGIPATNLFRILHKKGDYVWIEGTIINLLHDESVNGFIINYRDISHRKDTEHALQESEFRYRQIVETAQEGIWLIDEHAVTTFVNRKLCEILGYPQEEIIGKEIFCFMNDLGTHEALKALKTQEKGIAENLKARFITKTGNHIWVNISGNPYHDDDGNYKGALAMVSDITDKKELEDLLDKVNNQARIGNWTIDIETDQVSMSAITRQILEVPPDYTFNMQTAVNFYKAGASREAMGHVIQEAITKNIPWDIELQLVTMKSKELWVRVIGEAEFINGKCIRLYGSFQDINTRKKAEIEVLQAYEEKNIILESIGDAFFAVDKDWIITYWNKEAEKIMGHPKNEVIGKHFWAMFLFPVDSESFRMYNHVKETNQVVHFEDYSAELKKWYEISAYPSINGLSVYFRDITERKKNWAQLNILNENLQKNAKDLAISNAELEQFAYVASHDLQEPLRMVTSFLTQIKKGYGSLLDERGTQYIHFAVDGAKRMRQIILDLLEFSRVGRLEANTEKVDLNKLLTDIIALYHNQIEDVKATVTFSHLPSLYTYKTPVRQVFQNLVSNALKYHSKGTYPVIDISCMETPGDWQFVVKDNGIGIDPDYFEKVFIIFQRLHNKDEYSGTGMGLAICKKIVENMGGKIWIESEEGKGCAFFFTLSKNPAT